MGSLAQRVTGALQNSKILKPVFIKVNNESLWYRQRKLLGSRKHLAVPIKLNTNTMRWESYNWAIRVRDEDGEIAPTKKCLSGTRPPHP